MMHYAIVYGLCCPVPEECGEAGLYIVPPMLPAASASDVWALDHSTDRQLQYSFIHCDDTFDPLSPARGFLPESLYHRLVAMLLKYATDVTDSFEHIFTTQAKFIGDETYQIERQPKGHDGNSRPAICLTVRETQPGQAATVAKWLSRFLDEICPHFKVQYRTEVRTMTAGEPVEEHRLSSRAKCQYGGKGKWKTVMLSLRDGKLSFMKDGKVIRQADVRGCQVRLPKTTRTGHPYAFRLDLSEADTRGESKYIVSVADDTLLQQWMAELEQQASPDAEDPSTEGTTEINPSADIAAGASAGAACAEHWPLHISTETFTFEGVTQQRLTRRLGPSVASADVDQLDATEWPPLETMSIERREVQLAELWTSPQLLRGYHDIWLYRKRQVLAAWYIITE
jgi:hypothetical protein